MKDQMKMCGRCGHEHAVGVLRHSQDGVALYGARRCVSTTVHFGRVVDCSCNDFAEAVTQPDGTAGLPVAAPMSQGELAVLWNDTEFLSPQASAETRIAVRRVMELAGEEREKAFMGLLLANVSDIRGALSKDESKFAHLVSHTDDIVESMRGVTQLSERLNNVVARIGGIEDRLDRLAELLMRDKPEEPRGITMDELAEAARTIFRPTGASDREKAIAETIITDAKPANS
jgi:hypothetical protein